MKIYSIILFLVIVQISLPCGALEKDRIVVIANRNVRESVALADYYIKERDLSRKQLIVLDTVTTESCTRWEYKKDIAEPVRAWLKQKNPDPNTTCLLLMYGMPLIIGDPEPAADQTKKSSKRFYDILAAVDSELAMVYEDDYPLSGWIDNPLLVGTAGRNFFSERENIFMTCRLDGPTPDTVRRIIDDSIATEKHGLRGSACFDARWPEEQPKKMNAYRRFDQRIHAAAKKTIERGILPCKINTIQSLFQTGDCPDTALYCGWYSLAAYVDAFEWARGAVAYHVASAECATLKRKSSRVWCKVLLEKGVAATLGPVGEPYLQSFPRPDIFFGWLFDGRSLAEAYMKSTPYLSWKMVLIGDPMYRPFKNGNPDGIVP